MAALRQKSEQLTGFLEYLLTPHADIQILTPDDPNQRGCQISLLVRKNGKALFNYLTDRASLATGANPTASGWHPHPYTIPSKTFGG